MFFFTYFCSISSKESFETYLKRVNRRLEGKKDIKCLKRNEFRVMNHYDIFSNILGDFSKWLHTDKYCRKFVGFVNYSRKWRSQILQLARLSQTTSRWTIVTGSWINLSFYTWLQYHVGRWYLFSRGVLGRGWSQNNFLNYIISSSYEEKK